MENCEFEEVVEHGLVVALRDLSTGRIIPMVSGSDDAEDDDKDKKKPDAEGDAGKLDDENAARAGADDGAKDDDDDDAAGDDDDQDAADSGDKKIPGKRFKKVIDQRNKTRAELAAANAELETYRKYKKEIADEEAAKLDEENRKKGIPTVAEQNAQLDKILDRRFGEGAADDFAAFRETRQMELSRHIREGQAHLRGLLTEYKLGNETKGEAFEAWNRHVAAAIRTNPERLAKFRNPITQTEAIDEAFKEVKRFLVDPAVAATSAGKIKTLERRRASAPSSSGRPSAPEMKLTARRPPDSMKDPRERARAWDKIIEDASKEIDAMDAE